MSKKWTPTPPQHDNPTLLLQDCDRKLAKWFASRLDAQAVVRDQWQEAVEWEWDWIYNLTAEQRVWLAQQAEDTNDS